MIWGAYLLLVPLAIIIFLIGLMMYLNKFGTEHFGFEFLEKDRDKQSEVERQKASMKKNKIFGVVFMVFSILILVVPVVF